MIPDKKTKENVLVTGGGGYLAGWIIIKLLEQGYKVHATVRDVTKAPEMRAALVKAGAPLAADSETLLFFEAELEADQGWKEAASDCKYTIHTASPFPPAQSKSDDEIVIPARDGTLRVLQASLDAGVSRVVVTSSASAMEYTSLRPAPAVITEDHWTDIKRHDITPYVRSKTIAEQAAWDFADQHKGSIALAVVAPGTMLGPVLGSHVSFSVLSVKQLLDGSAPALPKLGFGFVDVRDVADLHILAMTETAAAGQRYLGAGTFLWLSDVARILRERLPADSARVPARILPDFASRLIAIFTPSLRPLIHNLSKKSSYSSRKAESQLGWSTRPIEDTIVDTARSLVI